ncbi:MAG: TM1812 family CRISPR-associated protein [Intestinibacter bartlettii]|nr:TM1812 family CRISPR-associated protein [Intestinibacter bartlettii]
MGENRSKNKLILFLSKYKFTTDEYKYSSKYDNTENEIKGIQTPDAPTKYFINYLLEKKDNNDERVLDTILCITSEATNNKSINKRENNKEYKSAFEDYQEMLNEFCDEKGIEPPELIKLNFDYDFENNKSIDEADVSRRLYESIVKELDKNDTIYIDYTSGIRDTSLLIILIIRYLEYTGIKCGGMIYSYYDNDDKSNNKIIDIKSTYELFELLNGVNEFTSFGKAKALSEYYEKTSDKDCIINANEKSKEEDKKINQKDEAVEKINDLIDVMKRFSDVISLCMVQEIDNIMKQLQDGISEVKKVLNPNQKQNQEKSVIFSLKNSMFYNLITQIENKFYIEDGKDITYIDIIRWCLDNDLIQQALTLYVEKIPQYYLDDKHKFFDTEEESLKDSISKGNEDKSYANIFYTKIFSNIWFNRFYYPLNYNELIDNNKKINEVKNIVEKYKQQILDRDVELLDRCEDNIKDIIYEIYKIIDKIYENEKESDTEIKVGYIKLSKNDKLMPKTKEKFINTFKVNNKLIANILEELGQINSIYNMECFYANNTKEYTLNRKINSIIILRKSDINPLWLNNKIDLNEFVELMEDYVYFKIMRNQINHASSDELKDEVINYLTAQGYKVDINEKGIKDEIKKIMYRSIDSIASIAEKIEDNKENEDKSEQAAITSEA